MPFDRQRAYPSQTGALLNLYSRRADGRAVLRSSLRELVCSEAMFHLGVPTTRALSLVLMSFESWPITYGNSASSHCTRPWIAFA